MRGISTIAPAFFAVIAVAAPAAAADPALHPPVITADSVVPDDAGSGWYLRGDIGVAVAAAPSMSWQSTAYSDRKMANAGIIGFGFGYKLSENIRNDVTLDFLTNHQIKGAVNPTTEDRLTQSAATLMLNGYYDIGTYSGFTPYIGVGLGIARTDSSAPTREINGIPTYAFAGAARYSLATSAATGLSFDIGHGLLADVGYKFTWIDKTRTGLETTSTLAGPVNIGDTGVHQFRVGLRYLIN